MRAGPPGRRSARTHLVRHVLAAELDTRLRTGASARLGPRAAVRTPARAPARAEEWVQREAKLARHDRVEVEPERQHPRRVRDHEPEGEADGLGRVHERAQRDALLRGQEDAVVEGEERVRVVGWVPLRRAGRDGCDPEDEPADGRGDHDEVGDNRRGARPVERAREQHAERDLQLRPDLEDEEERAERAREVAQARRGAEPPEEHHRGVREERVEAPLDEPVGGSRQAHHHHERAQLELLLLHDRVGERGQQH